MIVGSRYLRITPLRFAILFLPAIALATAVAYSSKGAKPVYASTASVELTDVMGRSTPGGEVDIFFRSVIDVAHRPTVYNSATKRSRIGISPASTTLGRSGNAVRFTVRSENESAVREAARIYAFEALKSTLEIRLNLANITLQGAEETYRKATVGLAAIESPVALNGLAERRQQLREIIIRLSDQPDSQALRAAQRELNTLNDAAVTGAGASDVVDAARQQVTQAAQNVVSVQNQRQILDIPSVVSASAPAPRSKIPDVGKAIGIAVLGHIAISCLLFALRDWWLRTRGGPVESDVEAVEEFDYLFEATK
jgi:hypothetical protein